MDFNGIVLAQLQSIVGSQSRVLESQGRLTRTIECFVEGLQKPSTPSTIDLRADHVASHLVGVCDSQGSRQGSLDDSAWPSTIQARFSEKDRARPSNQLKTDLACSIVARPSELLHVRSSAINACVILPESRRLTVLDIVGALVAVWDLLITSFVLAWDMQKTRTFWISACISSPCWTLDILKHFLMAFYEKGVLRTGQKTIAIAYVRTYFFIDIFLVLLDWGILAELTFPYLNNRLVATMRAFQIIKLVRISQLFRILSRLHARWNLYAERRFSERNRLVVFHLIAPAMYIVCGLHFLACLFYYVGAGGLNSHGSSYFQALDHLEDGIVFAESSLINRYLTAFHCATASVSLAGNFEAPMSNPLERSVMIFALLVGFIFGSVLISSTSAAIVDYQNKQQANGARLSQLRKYLCENDVRLEVYQRVVKQAEERLVASDRLKEEDVDALAFLPKQLIVDLRLEILWPPLQRHPLFRLYQMLDSEVPRRICHQALSFVHLAVGDELFRERDMAENGYILTLGELHYVQTPTLSKVESRMDTIVDLGNWLSEAALFSKWIHVGLARATLSSRLLAINAAALARVVLHRDPVVRAIAVEYACEFHRRVVVSSPRHPLPNDIRVPSTDYCEIVMALSVECQVEIGKCATFNLARAHSDALLDEILNSKAVIILNQDGEVCRFKSIVVLQVEQHEGNSFLVEVGKVEGKLPSPSVVLPGCTLERGELINDCIERAVQTKFAFLNGKIEVVSTKSEVVECTSKDFGVQTRYCRNVVHCKVNCHDDLVLPAVSANTYFVHEQYRSLSRFSNESESDKAPPPLERLKFVVDWDNGTKGIIYAWLSASEFDYLRSAKGAEWLRMRLLLADFIPPHYVDY